MQRYDQCHHPDVVDTRVALYFSALAKLHGLSLSGPRGTIPVGLMLVTAVVMSFDVILVDRL